MKYNSLLLISSSDTISYEQYNTLPLEQLTRYKNLTNFRMIYWDGGFRAPLDIINKCTFEKYYSEASANEKRAMNNIWNLATANGALAINTLIDNGVDCRIITNFDNSLERIAAYLKETKNPVIGISTTFMLNWSEVGRIVKKVRSFSTDVKIVLGGAFVSSNFSAYGQDFFVKTMKKHQINYILTSPDSEQDLPLLFSALNGIFSFQKVSNALYLDDCGEVVRTDAVPHKAIVTLGDAALNAAIQSSYKRTLQLRTSVGCPFACKFCSYSGASLYVCEDLANLECLLDKVYKSGMIDNIVFIDDNLNVPPARFNALLDLMMNFHFTWYGFIRVQFIDDAVAAKMKKSGCDGVYLGLESGSDRILALMNKKSTVEKYVNGVTALKKAGLRTFASFIVGLPGETEETISETIDFIEHRVALDYYALKEYYYDHNSPLFKEAALHGLSGDGNKWSHKTMASYEATVYKEKMYRQIGQCTHIDPDLGMWYLVYLRITGCSWDDISVLQKWLNRLLDYDLKDDFFSTEKESVFADLKDYLKRVTASK